MVCCDGVWCVVIVCGVLSVVGDVRCVATGMWCGFADVLWLVCGV